MVRYWLTADSSRNKPFPCRCHVGRINRQSTETTLSLVTTAKLRIRNATDNLEVCGVLLTWSEPPFCKIVYGIQWTSPCYRDETIFMTLVVAIWIIFSVNVLWSRGSFQSGSAWQKQTRWWLEIRATKIGLWLRDFIVLRKTGNSSVKRAVISLPPKLPIISCDEVAHFLDRTMVNYLAINNPW